MFVNYLIYCYSCEQILNRSNIARMLDDSITAVNELKIKRILEPPTDCYLKNVRTELSK